MRKWTFVKSWWFWSVPTHLCDHQYNHLICFRFLWFLLFNVMSATWASVQGGHGGHVPPHFSPKYFGAPLILKKWAPLHHPKVDNTPYHMSERELLSRTSKGLYMVHGTWFWLLFCFGQRSWHKINKIQVNTWTRLSTIYTAVRLLVYVSKQVFILCQVKQYLSVHVPFLSKSFCITSATNTLMSALITQVELS